jgi:hypothetical protein
MVWRSGRIYGAFHPDTTEDDPMHWRPTTAAATIATLLALSASGASANSMTTTLGAHLAGMGDKGTVELKITADAGKLCWAFDVPKLVGATRSTVNVGTGSKVLVELGMHYTKSGCETESKMTLKHLAAKPAAYSVWIDTKGHPGDLRGKLAAGMAKM